MARRPATARKQAPPANPRRRGDRPEPIDWDRLFRAPLAAAWRLEADATDIGHNMKRAKMDPVERSRWFGALETSTANARDNVQEIDAALPALRAAIAESNPANADPEAAGYRYALQAVRRSLDAIERARGWILNMPGGVPERMSAATVGLDAARRELDGVTRALLRQIDEAERRNPTPNYSREQMRQDLAQELAHVEEKIPRARAAVKAARDELADAKRRDLYPVAIRDAAERLRDAEAHLAVVEVDQRHYSAELAKLGRNPVDADELRAELAGGDNAHAAVATAIAIAPDVPPAPNPRGLVQLGGARQLDVAIADGGGAIRRYRWTLPDDWRTLTPAGAEQLPAGAGRLFLVPPPRSASSSPPADSAGVRTFVEWHQFEPREAFSADVPTVGEFATRLGRAVSIVYRSDKWQAGEPLDYEHEFKPSDPPEVLIIGTAERPRSVLVRGGAFRVTARGLVD